MKGEACAPLGPQVLAMLEEAPTLLRQLPAHRGPASRLKCHPLTGDLLASYEEPKSSRGTWSPGPTDSWDRPRGT